MPVPNCFSKIQSELDRVRRLKSLTPTVHLTFQLVLGDERDNGDDDKRLGEATDIMDSLRQLALATE